MGGVRDTSLEAYFEKVLPDLSRRQGEVLDIFYERPGRDLTNMEVARALGWSINRVTPRTYELREMGILEESCRRVCGVTGNNAYAWKVK